jgi:hypothetical protein
LALDVSKIFPVQEKRTPLKAVDQSRLFSQAIGRALDSRLRELKSRLLVQLQARKSGLSDQVGGLKK